MTIEQINAEQRLLEAQVNLAVEQFKKRCGLQDWQISVSWGMVKISTTTDGSLGQGREVYMATASVRV